MAPLIFRTYKASPSVSGFLPLTAERREEITAYLARLNNCREFETIPVGSIPEEGMRCFRQRGLLRQGEYFSYFSVPKYLALNAGAAVAGSGPFNRMLSPICIPARTLPPSLRNETMALDRKLVFDWNWSPSLA